MEHIFISYLPYTLEPPAVVLQWLLVLVIKNRLTNLSSHSKYRLTGAPHAHWQNA